MIRFWRRNFVSASKQKDSLNKHQSNSLKLLPYEKRRNSIKFLKFLLISNSCSHSDTENSHIPVKFSCESLDETWKL